MVSRVPILSYHAIIADAQKQLPPQWSRYHAIARATFCAQLDLLTGEGWRVLALKALEQPALPPRSMAITFDDGALSDLLAAEELGRRNLPAAFFVTWLRLGCNSFLSPSQVLDIDRQGFMIGSHGMTHVQFARLTPQELRDQLEGSKLRLEDLLGKPVTALALPHGSYNSAVIAAAVAAGYRSIMTSDFALAVAGSSVLPRLTIGARTTLEDFRGLLTDSRTEIGRRRMLNGVRRRLNRIAAIAAG
jgi:peptidoglycan/xylan/chitin deacetylase (PgdA/CDA1 family)